MKLLLIDNFDSFVYNIYQSLAGLGHDVAVIRNNEIKEDAAKSYDVIIISPGPGNPESSRDFGACREIILQAGNRIPILGICLGHQGITSAFGGKIIRAKKPMHGKTSEIRHSGIGIFAGMKNPLRVMRYHSLVADKATFPDCLEVLATSNDDNEIMALKHKSLPIYGVQFHPESIMTEEGNKLLENFLRCIK